MPSSMAPTAPLRQGLWQNSTVVGGSLHQVVMNNIRTSAARRLEDWDVCIENEWELP